MIYEKIKKECKKKGRSIRSVEKEAGLGNGTIGKWVTSRPTTNNIQAVANALGVKVSKLLE